jgi:hypothetical protein
VGIQGATARLHAEQLGALLQARLDALLEGYERHNVELDDQLSADIMKDVLDLRTRLSGTLRVPHADLGAVSAQVFGGLVDSSVRISPNSIKVQIDRRRFMPTTPLAGQTTTNIYHVYGHNPRWNTNSTDRSVNSVTLSNDEIFLTLQQKIESEVPQGDERKDILDKLQALKKDQESPSFARRYTEFIAVAANHIQVIYPFIPALTEILHKVQSR